MALKLSMVAGLSGFAAHAQAQDTVTPPPPPAVTADAPLAVQAQVLAIDSERFFQQSAFGRRILAEIEAEGQRLDAENTSIAVGLRREEQELTEQRATMTAQAFGDLADAFDSKVQQIRQEQSAKQQVLETRLDLSERQFLQAALPVLQSLMEESGALLIVEKRDVFIASVSIEITDQAIARIDAELGDGLRFIAGQEEAAPSADGAATTDSAADQ